jgi:hypothetical protein
MMTAANPHQGKTTVLKKSHHFLAARPG